MTEILITLQALVYIALLLVLSVVLYKEYRDYKSRKAVDARLDELIGRYILDETLLGELRMVNAELSRMVREEEAARNVAPDCKEEGKEDGFKRKG